MKLNFVLRSYVPTFLVLSLCIMRIQDLCSQTTVPCATNNNSLSAVTAITAQLPNPTVAGGTEARVPIWFFHVRETNGTPVSSNIDPAVLISSINDYFNGIFEFSLCGTTNIDNSNWHDLSLASGEQNALNNYAAINAPQSNQCIRVFFCRDIYVSPLFTTAGYTGLPSVGSQGAVYLSSIGFDSRTLAHEIGHYFGLLHTHANQPQYVNDFGESNCYNSGDGICDTPADPEEGSAGCLIDSDCMGYSCSITDPAGVAYMPDITNLMSYYRYCRNKFSPQQKIVMRAFYDRNPAHAFLSSNLSDCVKTPFGIVERDCGIDPTKPSISQLPALSVYLKHHNSITPCQSVTDNAGRFFWGGCNQPSTINTIEADNLYTPPLNGVTTLDLSLISRHILGIQQFTNPYKLIAADANFSGSVTTFDVVELRKLILGIYEELPDNTSWRYVPKEYLADQGFYTSFVTNLNPFAAKVTIIDPTLTPSNIELTYRGLNSYLGPKRVDLNTQAGSSLLSWSLWGVKIGDVNCSGFSNDGTAGGTERLFGTYPFETGAIPANGLRTVQIIASSPQPVLAWQVGAEYAKDIMRIETINSNNTIATLTQLENCHFDNKENSIASKGIFNALWYSEMGETRALSNSVIAEFEVEGLQEISQLHQIFKISSQKIPTVFYNTNGEIIEDVALSLRVLSESEGRATQQTGIDDTSITTYPSLPVDQINFLFTGYNNQEVKIRILNSTGNPIAESNTLLNLDNQEITIGNLGALPSGIYWYVVSAGNRIKQGKIVKQ